MRTSIIVYFIVLFSALFFSNTALPHAGSHGNDECIINVDGFNIRLNGYQFQGKFPEKHYCRHFPYLGKTIIKVDSNTEDLNGMAVELQLLKRNSWLGILLQNKDAFSIIKHKQLQFFSNQVVSISADLKDLDFYAIKLKLHNKNNKVTEQQFMFIAGLPFTKIMVGIAVILLLFIIFIFFRQLKTKQ
ncbi:MAG: hypothetical protein L3J59_03885 [Methylococcaceae bacterium]|nr:hypothetical protein [Methylococcaceae bacterium]